MQGMHDAEDVCSVLLENVPAKQISQAVLPVSASYWPLAHGVQDVLPVSALNWPSAHGVHACASLGLLVKYNPAAQVFFTQAALPVST
jgi:hypothetical protein